MTNEPTLVSLNTAVEMTSLSRSMINRYRAEGRFPKAVPLGDKRVAFVKSEVLDWIRERVSLRDRTPAAANDNLAARAAA